MPKDYIYDDSAGEGITVYVIDTGANPANPEYTGMSGKISWLWPAYDLWNILPEAQFPDWYPSETDPADHGACMMSKIAGPKYGVAKKANIVVVKIVTDQERGIVGLSILPALRAVKKHIETHATQGKAVVNFSLGLVLDPNDKFHELWIESAQRGISTLLQLNAVIVAAAGNSRVMTSIIFRQPL